MIHIVVGGKRREVAENTTVTQLLQTEKVEMPEYVSVSVNDSFIPHKSFNRQFLKDGDTVEFLYFMGGGAE